MEASTDPNVPVEQQKQKKKKANKNKKDKAKKANEAAQNQLVTQNQLATQTAGLENFAANTTSETANLMEKISKLFGGLGAPNLDKISEIEKQIDQEMNAIQDLLNKVSRDEFSSIPDENKDNHKEVTEEMFAEAKKKNPKHANGLNELKGKVDFLRLKHQEAIKLETSFPNDAQVANMFKVLKENLDDDITRNQNVFNLLINTIIQSPLDK